MQSHEYVEGDAELIRLMTYEPWSFLCIVVDVAWKVKQSSSSPQVDIASNVFISVWVCSWQRERTTWS